ncbi:MAG: WbqC family protein [bacterium]
MRKVAIIQSSYIPWKGYFDIINEVDIFIFLEDVQFTKRDWRSRNKIKTSNGTEWITIPILGGRNQMLSEAKIDNSQNWQKKHLNKLQFNYAKSNFFDEYFDDLKSLYEMDWEYLSDFNIALTKYICNLLNIRAKLLKSQDIGSVRTKDEKLIDLVKKVDGTCYISGPAAKSYIDPDLFFNAGIELKYKDYSGYPEYPQLHPPFNHYVTILDLIFSVGMDAGYYIWGWREELKSNIKKLETVVAN